MIAVETGPERVTLDRALAEHHGNVPCRTCPDDWHGDQDQRTQAAEACGWCPIRPACLAAALAAGETFGTWGGVDLEDATARRRAHRQQAARATTTPTEERTA